MWDGLSEESVLSSDVGIESKISSIVKWVLKMKLKKKQL